ncbi:MAG: hypothetical protein ABIJ94_02170 [candidate division WOR-3 bacterium]
MKNDLIGTYLKDVSEYPLLNDEQQRKLLQKTKKIGSYAFFKKKKITDWNFTF